MKVCPNCQTQLDDNVAFCPTCGMSFTGAPAPKSPVAVVDPTDHTAEYDAKDISDNKVIAMMPYLLDFIGVIIALLAINNSPFVSFHVKQAMKIMVCSYISVILVIIPFLGWAVMGIVFAIAFVLRIIGFIYVCKGKAKEIPIVSSLGFLK